MEQMVIILMVNDALLGAYTSQEAALAAMEAYKQKSEHNRSPHAHYNLITAVLNNDPRILG